MQSPPQSQADQFYGNPRGRNGQASQKWVRENLVWVRVPEGFGLKYDGQPVWRVRVHKKCAAAVAAAFEALYLASGENAKLLAAWGVNTFSGSYNYRLMRNGKRLSMHAYGCALDFDGGNKPLGSKKFFPAEVIKCFTDQGAINLPHDPMHFQWAIPG
jgi:hypothetical protein